MFRLIESLSQGFIRFLAVGKRISSGHIVQLVSIEGDIYVELSNGSRPFGIVLAVNNNIVKIYHQKMICHTSKFDKSLQYPGGAPLYAKEGILTTVPENESHPIVAHTITDHRPNKDILELNWI
jgi:hypothetical protein